MKKILLLIVFLFYKLIFSQESWGYEGELSPEHWSQLTNAKQCSIGGRQSPININNTTKNKRLPKIQFNYTNAVITNIVENEKCLQFVFKKEGSIFYNKKEYQLVQFHVHKESEHTIEGIRYPLELHFVHKSDDGDILVIGVMVKNGTLNSYFEHLNIFQELAKGQQINTLITFNPEKIYPKNKSYFQYFGSLTTPPCSEKVAWIIFKTPVTMTEEEIDTIAKHLPKHNNRPIQPLNGRQIFYK